MMRYHQWIEWFSSQTTPERAKGVREAIMAASGRAGYAKSMGVFYRHAIKQGKTFTIHLLPMVQP